MQLLLRDLPPVSELVPIVNEVHPHFWDRAVPLLVHPHAALLRSCVLHAKLSSETAKNSRTTSLWLVTVVKSPLANCLDIPATRGLGSIQLLYLALLAFRLLHWADGLSISLAHVLHRLCEMIHRYVGRKLTWRNPSNSWTLSNFSDNWKAPVCINSDHPLRFPFLVCLANLTRLKNCEDYWLLMLGCSLCLTNHPPGWWYNVNRWRTLVFYAGESLCVTDNLAALTKVLIFIFRLDWQKFLPQAQTHCRILKY